MKQCIKSAWQMITVAYMLDIFFLTNCYKLTQMSGGAQKSRELHRGFSTIGEAGIQANYAQFQEEFLLQQSLGFPAEIFLDARRGIVRVSVTPSPLQHFHPLL